MLFPEQMCVCPFCFVARVDLSDCSSENEEGIANRSLRVFHSSGDQGGACQSERKDCGGQEEGTD
jgi:hypothetical protein